MSVISSILCYALGALAAVFAVFIIMMVAALLKVSSKADRSFIEKYEQENGQ